MDVNQIIQRIGIIRTKANLSARALSLMIGKNSTYITKMEAGEFSPNLATLFDIIDACDYTPEEFFSSNFSSYKQDQQLSNIISNMPDKRKQTLLEFLQTIWHQKYNFHTIFLKIILTYPIIEKFLHNFASNDKFWFKV